jgi:hypothetical protein
MRGDYITRRERIESRRRKSGSRERSKPKSEGEGEDISETRVRREEVVRQFDKKKCYFLDKECCLRLES